MENCINNNYNKIKYNVRHQNETKLNLSTRHIMTDKKDCDLIFGIFN